MILAGLNKYHESKKVAGKRTEVQFGFVQRRAEVRHVLIQRLTLCDRLSFHKSHQMMSKCHQKTGHDEIFDGKLTADDPVMCCGWFAACG